MEKTIENYFCSKEFINVLASSTIPPDTIASDYMGCIMDASMSYIKATSNLQQNEEKQLCIDGLTDHLSNVLKKFETSSGKDFYEVANDVLDEKVKKFFKNDDESIKKFYAKTFSQNYLYHVTNSSYVESIKENGLSPENIKKESEKLFEVDNICKKNGFGGLIPFKSANNGNKIFYSLTLKKSYHYATGKPEWFSLILADAERIKGKINDFPENDRKQVMSFLSDSFEKFKNTNPVLLIVPPDPENIKKEREFVLDHFLSSSSETENLLNSPVLSMSQFCIDCCSDKTIDTKEATYVNLIPKEKIVQKITEQKHVLEQQKNDDLYISITN